MGEGSWCRGEVIRRGGVRSNEFHEHTSTHENKFDTTVASVRLHAGVCLFKRFNEEKKHSHRHGI